ncbi:hypothetical protein [Pseudomonas chlororaphis]|uniref:hypothetical protein n=1 Tax=Pseudomonas chlororaphis TaxID=587753 RepID=UPI001B300E29|nr:hypothetical protein [Pseudomonas chlororaphis]MBP5059337.1 hypothetical protein [Pseudomonas chlororaphis]MBP5142814.1 hypothetical protein [Pseudomonas chlororaphis]QTU03071.1 hypothetical protein HUT26_28590 [Pseudomonas chlororaphis]
MQSAGTACVTAGGSGCSLRDAYVEDWIERNLAPLVSQLAPELRHYLSMDYIVESSTCRVSASSIGLTADKIKPDLALSTYGIQNETVA